MSRTAVPSSDGVGEALSAALAIPVTWSLVQNVFELSWVKVKPVIAVAAMGDTPMSPIIFELGTVEIPAFVRITKFSALPRSTFCVKFDSKLRQATALGNELVSELGNALGIVLGTELG